MDTLDLGGGHWLRADAARSLMRCWDAGCPKGITDAGRTPAEQQARYDAYKAGTGNFAWPPTSPNANHVGGLAVDLPLAGRTWMRAHGAGGTRLKPIFNEWGWSGVENELWHYNYDPKHDKHLEDDVALSNEDIAKIVNAINTSTPRGYEHSGLAREAASMSGYGEDTPPQHSFTPLYAQATLKAANAILKAVKALSVGQIDYAKLANAVNDDAAARMKD